jgi:hypothetical protein
MKLDCTKRSAKINYLDKGSRNKWQFSDPVQLDGAVTGDIGQTGDNGQVSGLKFLTELVNVATATGTGTGTITLAMQIPAKCVVMGVTAYVHPILAGASLSTWSLGVTSDTDRYGTTLAIADTTSVNSLVAGATGYTAPHAQAAAVAILMTAAAGVFSTGKVRVTVHYVPITAATS